jgi:ADP-heptose:LPS heptosyltransferase
LDKFNDIDALSSLIDACDFIVTSSNVTAHIAGALGKETFLLLPYSSKSSLWYWQHSKNHSFWYPSIHIYKVGQMECWEDVIKKLVLDLKDYGRNY